jgi:hypothetical protein
MASAVTATRRTLSTHSVDLADDAASHELAGSGFDHADELVA